MEDFHDSLDKDAHLQRLFEQMAKEMKDWKFLEEKSDFPVEVSDVVVTDPNELNFMDGKVGSFVSIRPVDDPKTYLGVYVGSFIPPFDTTYHVGHNTVTKQLKIMPTRTNPAIYVFDLKKIVWGCESWWGEITSEKDLKQITDQDIQSVWYVQALKALQEEKKPNS
jgi:hypothetical protein